jgi:hypothetical protein
MPNNNAILFIPTGEVRRAKHGECLLHTTGDCIQNNSIETAFAYPILTRHEIEATPVVLRALGMEEE